MSADNESATSPFMCGVEAPITFQHDWGSEDVLAASIIQRMVEEAETDSTDVPDSLYRCIDPDALEDLFRPLQDGTPRTSGEVTFALAGHYVTASSDGTIEIESELGRLKRTGGNLLLTGDVPADVFERLSAQFLGEAAYDRTQLLALYGRNSEVARSRLSRADTNAHRAHLLTYEAPVRSTAQTSQSDYPGQPSVSTITGTIEDFQRAIDDEVFELQHQRRGFEPGELRFCFDSLRLLSDEEDAQTVEGFLRTVTNTVDEVLGLGHYVFAEAYDSSRVLAIEPLFDVTIQLKIGENGPEQRWHLHDTDYTTIWFPV
ncbi:hypothetical protein SAMN05421858_1231 [Haladaptatus litoreus]|uniref:Halobacterial output domain-containing protein n=1 Tax=Haladaptatus litoreus TaxID=553468 RepID=A0A1N6XQG9_9EURY|nr:HalOD1 output domain-containing protein [Haladaptatus litoreus]SIR04562.1 hypothetical protein SAMN05421858_1231 [Haladaptatus litoreus]